MPEPYLRRRFRCVFEDAGATLSTGIYIDVPAGLTRQQAIDYVTGIVAREVGRYAAQEALGFGPTTRDTNWSEIVT